MDSTGKISFATQTPLGSESIVLGMSRIGEHVLIFLGSGVTRVLRLKTRKYNAYYFFQASL